MRSHKASPIAPVAEAGSGLSWPLLDRYYSGEATSDEQRQVDRYFAERPDQARISQEVADTIRAGSAPSKIRSQTRVDSMLAEAHGRMAAPKAALKRFVQTYFGGSVQQAVAALMDLADTEMSDAEIAELRRSIQRAAEEGR